MVRELLHPSPIRTFALKALGIFVLWYVLYELWLLPDGRLDYWVALRVIDGAAFVTKLMGFLSILIPMIEPLLEQSSNVEYYRNATSLNFIVTNGLSAEANVIRDYTYMMAFNSLYLFTSLGLLIINDLKSSLFTLSAIHATGWITATMFLFAGLTLHPNWWIGSDLITVYLLPLASMALVAIRYAQQLTIASS